MSRRQLREEIFKLLFRVEFNSREDMPTQCELFFDDIDVTYEDGDEKYIQDKYNKISEKLDEIDRMIDERTEGWSADRMGKVDLTIIRLGIYEILFDDEIPASIAINEAVELAGKFGQDKSKGFVNAILAKFAPKE